MPKKYFVSVLGRQFAVTVDQKQAGGPFRLQVASETGTAEREGRILGSVAQIDGRVLRREALSEVVLLGNRRGRFECAVSDRPPLLAAQAANETRSRHRLLCAPLPGQVAAVLVRADDRVRAGQRLVVIEAMKMQNPILAERDGRVLQVFVNPGDTVQVGARLVDVGD